MSENRRNKRRNKNNGIPPLKSNLTKRDKIYWIIVIIILVMLICFILFLKLLEIFIPIELLDEH